MIQRRAKRGHSKRLPAALLWAGVLLSTLILVAVEFHVVQVRPNLRLGTGAAPGQPSPAAFCLLRLFPRPPSRSLLRASRLQTLACAAQSQR